MTDARPAPRYSHGNHHLIRVLTAEAVLDTNPLIASAQRSILDRILAVMEVYRQRPGTNPEADYTMRLAEAIVAKAAGYEDRANWSFIEDAVRKDLQS